MLEIFQYNFMIRAFVAGIITAVIAPIIGNFLIVRRFSMVADTLSHIALAGVAVGLLTNTQPMLITIILTVFAAILIEKIRSNNKIPGETILAMFLPGGLAVAIILISLANGFNSNLFSYLFGSIATVQSAEIWPMLVLGFISLATVSLFYKQLLFTSFDEQAAKLNGIKVKLINLLLMTLTAIAISLAMRVVGILLISALMVIPSMTGMTMGRSFKKSFIYSIVFAILAVIIGLYSAFYLNLPAGGSIVLTSLLLFAITNLIRKK